MEPLSKAELRELMEDAAEGRLPPPAVAKELALRAKAGAAKEKHGHIMQAYRCVANGLNRGSAKVVYDFCEKLVKYYLPD